MSVETTARYSSQEESPKDGGGETTPTKKSKNPPTSRWAKPVILISGRESAPAVPVERGAQLSPPMFDRLIQSSEQSSEHKDEDKEHTEDDDEESTETSTSTAGVEVAPETSLADAIEFAMEDGEEGAMALSEEAATEEEPSAESPDAAEMPAAEFAPAELAEGADEDDASVVPSASGGSPPPIPPLPPPPPPRGGGPGGPPPPPGPSFGGGPGNPNWNAQPLQQPNYNTAPVVATQTPEQQVRDAEYTAERRGLRRGLVAGFITGYIVKAHVERLKRNRKEKEAAKELNKRDEQMQYLQGEHQRLEQQVKAQAEARKYERPAEQVSGPSRPEQLKPLPTAESLPTVESAPEAQLYDEEGNEIVLQHGWRVERSSGGYSVVLDEHNRVVYDAIHYGEAYQRDRKREQVAPDAFDAANTSAPADAGAVAAQAAVSMGEPSQTVTSAQSPAAPSDPRLAGSQQAASDRRKPLAAAVGSPWLWTAVAVLLIVYFLAALA